jgi:hypothetical protein
MTKSENQHPVWSVQVSGFGFLSSFVSALRDDSDFYPGSVDNWGVLWLNTPSHLATLDPGLWTVKLVGYPSGQRGQTVNLLAYAFDGSNPSPTTISGAKTLYPANRLSDTRFLVGANDTHGDSTGIL